MCKRVNGQNWLVTKILKLETTLHYNYLVFIDVTANECRSPVHENEEKFFEMRFHPILKKECIAIKVKTVSTIRIRDGELTHVEVSDEWRCLHSTFTVEENE